MKFDQLHYWEIQSFVASFFQVNLFVVVNTMMLFAYFMATVFFAIEARVAMKTLMRLLRFGGTR